MPYSLCVDYAAFGYLVPNKFTKYTIYTKTNMCIIQNLSLSFARTYVLCLPAAAVQKNPLATYATNVLTRA